MPGAIGSKLNCILKSSSTNVAYTFRRVQRHEYYIHITNIIRESGTLRVSQDTFFRIITYCVTQTALINRER